MAAPRPRRARYTAATAFGRLVTAASTIAPTTMPGIESRVPSVDAARSIATLAPTTTARVTSATTTSPCCAPATCATSISRSSSVMADRSQRDSAPPPRRSRRLAARAAYGPRAASTSTAASHAGNTPQIVATQRPATHNETAPVSTMARRWSATRPATTAPRPTSAARLNTLDPTTTPEPTSGWCPRRAATDAVISGAVRGHGGDQPQHRLGQPEAVARPLYPRDQEPAGAQAERRPGHEHHYGDRGVHGPRGEGRGGGRCTGDPRGIRRVPSTGTNSTTCRPGFPALLPQSRWVLLRFPGPAGLPPPPRPPPRCRGRWSDDVLEHGRAVRRLRRDGEVEPALGARLAEHLLLGGHVVGLVLQRAAGRADA